MGSLALLAGSAFYLPLELYVERSAELNRGYRLAIYGLLVLAVLGGISWLLVWSGVLVRSALNGVATAWLVVGFTPGSVSEPDPRKLIWVVVAVLGGILVGKLSVFGWSRYVSGVVGFVLVASPPLQLLGQLWERPDAILSAFTDAPVDGVHGSKGPDVWFVVLDGYPSGRSRTDLFAGVDDLSPWLAGEGFEVNSNTLTPYARTKLAVPALLMGDAFVTESENLSPGDMAVLREIVGGNNKLVQVLTGAGYHITVVENGWHLSGCSSVVDECVPPPLLDEQLSIVAEQLALGAALGLSSDDALGRGADHSRRWLFENAHRIDSNGIPDAIIVHLLAPHPPLRWSEDCEVEPDSHIRSGLAVALPNTPPTVRLKRLKLLEGQLECVDRTIRSLVDRLSPETVMVLVGDHGTDSLGQFGTAADKWTMDMIEERMLTLAALRLPSGCAEDVDLTIDLVSRILTCLTENEVKVAESRVFLPRLMDDSGTSVIELDSETVGHLLRLGR